jgi:hypothetical protein
MEKIFAQGLRFEINPKAPQWIKGKLSFKVDEFITFLKQHETKGGWVNIDLKESKGGKYYAELNQWKPEKPDSLKENGKTSSSAEYPEGINTEEIPF